MTIKNNRSLAPSTWLPSGVPPWFTARSAYVWDCGACCMLWLFFVNNATIEGKRIIISTFRMISSLHYRLCFTRKLQIIRFASKAFFSGTIPSHSCPYTILGVPPNSDDATVKRAFLKAAMHSHPDRSSNNNNGESSAEAHATFILYRQAFEQIVQQNSNLITNRESSLDPEIDPYFRDDHLAFDMDDKTRKEVIRVYETLSQGGKDKGGYWEMARQLAERESSRPVQVHRLDEGLTLRRRRKKWNHLQFFNYIESEGDIRSKSHVRSWKTAENGSSFAIIWAMAATQGCFVDWLDEPRMRCDMIFIAWPTHRPFPSSCLFEDRMGSIFNLNAQDRKLHRVTLRWRRSSYESLAIWAGETNKRITDLLVFPFIWGLPLW